MVRSFLPVGQGAFYCECFKSDKNSFNIVYDCGSLPDQGIVEREIRNHFQKGERIDALFISHLDEDHINGIPYLLKYCNVKRIYFPLIASENRGIMDIYYLSKNIHGFTYDFFMDPFGAIEDLDLDVRPQLIQIEEGEEAEERERWGNDLDIDRRESGTNVFKDIKRAYDLKDNIYDEWLYIPFNFRQNERVKLLLVNLEKQFIRRIEKEEVAQIWRDNASGDRNKIREAYRKIPGGFNTNSMTLFSGTTTYRLRQFYSKCLEKCCFGCYGCKLSGCLYLGDYDASGKIKWEKLTNAYKKYWEYIGCVQIPHHGSKYNFNNGLLEMNAFFVISAGYSNRFRHPHSCVLKKFLLENKMPYIVTDQVGSAAFFRVC